MTLLYRVMTGWRLDLDKPVTWTEKLQWLKLYDNNRLYPTLVDKVAVKDYVDSLGESICVPRTFGVWERFSDIDFERLPEQFVLKTTHDSGGTAICRNRAEFDAAAAKKVIRHSMGHRLHKQNLEWPYSGAVPRILAEELLPGDPPDRSPIDYKFFCFNGRAECVLVCTDRDIGYPKLFFFDRSWRFLRYNRQSIALAPGFSLPKPPAIDEMFDLAGRLSRGMPFVRVDLYWSKDRIYFGEFTFYPTSGFYREILPEANLYLGSRIDLRLSAGHSEKGARHR
ncbi:MAG: hypothetical protein LBC97_02915 [Bifidobacteriaceae bacterium]|nr:hypothetical protein [Bifidobacteriaceae bacterium]